MQGVGKTHLAIGLVCKTLKKGHSVLFLTAAALVTQPPGSLDHKRIDSDQIARK